MPEHESSIFAAELGEARSVDLHGMDVASAERELDAFLNHEFFSGTDVVKIIHGRGEQKLKGMVQVFLSKQPFVEYFRGSQKPAESNAVTYAVLARKS